MAEDSGTDGGGGEADGDDVAALLGTALALGGALVVLVVVGYVILAGGGSQPGSVATDGWDGVAAGEGPTPTLVAADGSTGEDAVTVVYYGDFQCPHCRAFEAETFPRLREEYVATGDVRFVFRPVNLASTRGWARNSRAAALGAHCVWDRDRDAYWRWHAAVFERQERPDTTWATPSALGDVAAELGLDGDAVSSCIRNESQIDGHRASMRAFRDSGIGSTPGFSVEGERFAGNDYDRLAAAIDAQLDGEDPSGGDEPTSAPGGAAA